MPESTSAGLINPRSPARSLASGRTAHVVRRPTRPHIRRSLDGFALPPAVPKIPTQPNQGQVNSVPKPRAPRSPRSMSEMKPALPRQSRSIVLKRPPMQVKTKRRRTRSIKRSPISFLMVSVAVAVAICGAAVSYLGWMSNQKAPERVEVLASSTANQGVGVPSEEEITPNEIINYRVAPDMPRLIKIPRLNVDARIKRLGMESNGMLTSPINVFDAGWYDGSSKPGENGAVLINGHVHGPTKPGVFARLNNLKQGDTVEIERGDGKKIIYQVSTTESVDQNKIDMAKVLTPIEPGKQGLNIITNSGRYDIKTNKYEQSLVVYLVQQ